MNRRHIHIERLTVHVPHELAGQARELGGDLGRDILRALAETTRGMAGQQLVKDIVTRKTRGAGDGAAQLSKSVAAQVAGEIQKRLAGKE